MLSWLGKLFSTIFFALTNALWDVLSKLLNWIIDPDNVATVIIAVLNAIIGTLQAVLPEDADTALTYLSTWIDTTLRPAIRLVLWLLGNFTFANVLVLMFAFTILNYPIMLLVRLLSMIVSRIWGGGSN